MVSIQSSHTSPSKCRCSSPSKNLMSCSFLTPWLYYHSYLSCGDVIYGISYLCSFSYLSCGDVICGIVVVCFNYLDHWWHYPYRYWYCRWFHFTPHHFFVPSNLCFPIPFSLLSLRLFLLRLYLSS
jgi:hypothetical protein